MQRNKKFSIFPKFSDRFIFIGALALSIIGSIMIISAEMGESTADLEVLSSTTIKQFIFLFVGIIGLIVFTKVRFIKVRIQYIWFGYFVVLALLIVARLFTPIGGAYGWIHFGGFSFQPSEFAKLYIIFLGAKIFSIDNPKTNVRNFAYYTGAYMLYVFVVFVIQNDFGSAFVIFAIAYVCSLIAPYKEIKKYQNWMMIILVLFITGAIFLLSNAGTKLLEHFDDSYQIKRFLASANPFAYQYDSGYHLIMSLVSFATGGLFGLGYGKSIHKFMNFPNPSTDFILPVIVEEMGILGFSIIVVLYGFILVGLAINASRCIYARGKIAIVGTFMYFIIHFVLNVGGVSGLIPLTGVPLLLISSGGSSLVSSLCAIGFAESEIIKYRQDVLKKDNENNSGQV